MLISQLESMLVVGMSTTWEFTVMVSTITYTINKLLVLANRLVPSHAGMAAKKQLGLRHDCMGHACWSCEMDL